MNLVQLILLFLKKENGTLINHFWKRLLHFETHSVIFRQLCTEKKIKKKIRNNRYMQQKLYSFPLTKKKYTDFKS